MIDIDISDDIRIWSPPDDPAEADKKPKQKFPRKLSCLFLPCRYKILYGGRGGAKSWGIARCLLIQGSKKPLRVMCAREIQKSLKESVYQLLCDQIAKIGLEDFYEVLESSIRGRNGTQFMFSGLRHNPASLKSVEGCDIVWIEECQVVSKESLDILIPTIRKPGSEIWASMNPRLDSDESYRRFILNPPRNSMVIPIGWQDNPWFPAELEAERLDLLERDPQGYKNIWDGETISAIEGAIYAAEIAEAEKEHRIGNVPRDRTLPVHTFWDLGFGDCTAVWFAQAMPDGSFRIVDYLENSGKTIDWYMIQLQQKGYLYGYDWIPHDGVDMIIHAKLGADPTRSIEMLMRNAGRNVRLVPKQYVVNGINAARTIFNQCWFDREHCAIGLEALRHYQWAPRTAAGVESRQPLHNFASHGADAFRMLAYGLKTPPMEQIPPQTAPRRFTQHSWQG